MNKRFFTVLTVSICSVWAMAQTDGLVIDDVNLAPGGSKEVAVYLEDAKGYTALQFDLTLPEGISIAKNDAGELKVSLNKTGEDDHELYVANVKGNTYRFLSFSMTNAKYANLEKPLFNMTLVADKEATGTLQATSDGALLVTPACEEVTPAQALYAINVAAATLEEIEFKEGGRLAIVSDKDLDFSGLEDVKAYIATGYDAESSMLWLSRVTDVPANTPIIVKGAPSTTVKVPVGTSKTYYPASFMRGSVTAATDVDKTEGYYNFVVSQKTGKIGVLGSSTTSVGAGKVYIHVNGAVTSTPGSTQTIEIPAGGKLAYVAPCDLDFTGFGDDLKAYTVTAFDKDGTIWLSRVDKASVGTPLLLKGAKGESYDVPSSAAQLDYDNMLKGSATESTALNPKMDGNTIFVLSKGKGSFGILGKDATLAAGTAYLPVPTSYVVTTSSSRGVDFANGSVLSERESEVIGLYIDVNATGIDSMTDVQRVDDVYYNLQGQRVEKPGKGIYIKNGKKVMVK